MKLRFSAALTFALLATTWLTARSFAAEARPLDIWISSYQDKVYYESMVKRYQSLKDKNFQANIHAYGFREMPDKLAVAIKTGVNPPDIVQLDEVLFGVYLQGPPPFVDLTDRVRKSGLDKDIPAQRLGLFNYGGKQWGIPQSLSAMLLYYRTDTFEKYNIKPEDLATWDSFVRVGEELAAKRQAMIAMDPSYFEILLRQRGSDWFGKDGKPFPDEAAAKDTLQFLYQLQQKNIAVVPDRASIFDPVFFSGDISNEEVFCVIGADWYGLDMIQQFSSDLAGKWGAMPLPAWRDKNGKLGRRTSAFAGQGLMIYQGCQQVEPAWRFIEWVMTDTEANVERFTKGNSFPAYKPVWKDDRLLADNAFFNGQSLGQLLVDLAPDVPTVAMNPRRPQAVFMFQESFFSQFMYGQLTADEVVSKMKQLLSGSGGPPKGDEGKK